MSQDIGKAKINKLNSVIKIIMEDRIYSSELMRMIMNIGIYELKPMII